MTKALEKVRDWEVFFLPKSLAVSFVRFVQDQTRGVMGVLRLRQIGHKYWAY